MSESGDGAIYGGIEAGGTKFVCGAGRGPDDLLTVSFPTTTPQETIAQAVGFFREVQQRGDAPLAGIGIGSFGPVNLDPASPHYGYITSTPKPGWPYTDLAGAVGEALGVPVGFDTDVNAAALGENLWGAAQGLGTFVYITVGTGVGGGVMCNGALLHGIMHPEFGHVMLPHDMQADPFPGVCPYHGDCLEGLASGPAVKARWGRPAQELPPDHPAWPLEARYLGLALAGLVCTLSPQRILLGGGIMQQAHLLPIVRREVRSILNGYVQVPAITDDAALDRYIVPPGLGGRAGVLGSLALGQRAAEKKAGNPPV